MVRFVIAPFFIHIVKKFLCFICFVRIEIDVSVQYAMFNWTTMIFSIYFIGQCTWRREMTSNVAYSSVLGKRCLNKPRIFSSPFFPLSPMKEQR